MPAEFLYLKIESLAFEQRCDLSPKSHGGAIRLFGSVSENVADFLLHAPAITLGTALKANFHALFEIADDKLGHDGTSSW